MGDKSLGGKDGERAVSKWVGLPNVVSGWQKL